MTSTDEGHGGQGQTPPTGGEGGAGGFDPHGYGSGSPYEVGGGLHEHWGRLHGGHGRRFWGWFGSPSMAMAGYPGMVPGAAPMSGVEDDRPGPGWRRRRGMWGPWGGGWGGFGGHGGGRARRGDVRAAVLTLLTEQPMHGYQIIQELEARSGGAWRPSPGSVYPTLQLLEDEGLVTAQAVEGKKVFTITEAGRAHLAGLGQRDRAPWDEVAGDGPSVQRDLRDAIGQLAIAVMQVARAGSDEQTAKVLQLLNDARKKVYAILAEG